MILDLPVQHLSSPRTNTNTDPHKVKDYTEN